MLPSAQPTVPRSIVGGTRTEHTQLELECVAGAVPPGLQGHYFVVAPAGTVSEPRLPDDRAASQMCGDGMVCRVDFGGGRARATTRLARTPCLLADEGTWADRGFTAHRFRSAGLGRVSPALGARNFLNCAFQAARWGDDPARLFLTYDAGRPFELDPSTLELRTPLGHLDEWRPAALAGHPHPVVLSPAHPAFDGHTGELFTVSYGRSAASWAGTLPAAAGLFARAERGLERVAGAVARHVSALAPTFTELVRFRGAGALERHPLVLPDGRPLGVRHCIHQVAASEDWVVLLDTGFKLGFQQLLHRTSWPRRLVTRPQMAQTILYLVSRRALDQAEPGAPLVARPVALPMESDHFLVDYRNPDGRLTVHLAHCPATDLAEWVRPGDVSPFSGRRAPAELAGMMAVGGMDVNRLGRYVIDAATGAVCSSRVVSDDRLTWALALYAGRDVDTHGPAPDAIEKLYWCSEGFFPELLTRFVHDLYRDHPGRLTSLDQIREMAERGGRPASIFRADARSLDIEDAWVLPSDTMPSSIQFVPRHPEGSATDGWLVAFLFTPEAAEVAILDADALEAGPVARLRHPELRLGFSFHTAWLPELERRPARYRIDLREELDARLGRGHTRTLYETHVFPQLAG